MQPREVVSAPSEPLDPKVAKALQKVEAALADAEKTVEVRPPRNGSLALLARHQWACTCEHL